MDSLVNSQVTALGITLATLGTRIGLHSGVSSLVAYQQRLLDEGFPTLRTGVRLLPCMDSLVNSQVSAIGETLPAL